MYFGVNIYCNSPLVFNFKKLNTNLSNGDQNGPIPEINLKLH